MGVKPMGAMKVTLNHWGGGQKPPASGLIPGRKPTDRALLHCGCYRELFSGGTHAVPAQLERTRPITLNHA